MSVLSVAASRSRHHHRCRRRHHNNNLFTHLEDRVGRSTISTISSLFSLSPAVGAPNDNQCTKNPMMIQLQQDQRKQRRYGRNYCCGGDILFDINGNNGNMNQSMQRSSSKAIPCASSNTVNALNTFARNPLKIGNRSIALTRRYLATKKKKKNSKSKKGKFVLPNSNTHNHAAADSITDNNSDKNKNTSGVFGTARTGLILPNKELIIDQQASLATSADTNTNQQNLELLQDDTNNIYSPLLDQSLTNASSSSPPSSSSSMPPMSTPSPLLNSSMNMYNIVDQTTMYNPAIHLPNKPNFNDPSKNYEPSTPLGEELFKYIAVVGSPITVAEYMARCLRDESFGYYTNPPKSTDLDTLDDSEEEEDDDDDVSFDDNDNDNSNSNSQVEEEGGRGHRLIGQAGDFTTAPEISQIFGECLTIWLLTQYEALHRPSKVQLVELGPGRGTLMCDILRSASGIKGVGEDFIRALSGDGRGDGKSRNQTHGVHFVEVSESLRLTQREALESLLAQKKNSWSTGLNFKQWETKKEKEKRLEGIMKKIHEEKSLGKDVDDELLRQIITEQEKDLQGRAGVYGESGTNDSIPIYWHDTFDAVPFQSSSSSSETVPTFIICQEFFDALPVHVFQKTDDGWKERLVDVAIDEDEEDSDYGSGGDSHNGRTTDGKSNRVQVRMIDGTTASVLAPTPTASPRNEAQTGENNGVQKKKSRFRFVLSPDSTPAMKSLLRIDNNSTTTLPPELDAAPSGTVMEVSPEALSLVQDIALRIDECQGAALIIDYGNEGSRDTLRAFQKHEQVDVLSSPGNVDITADVDFSAMKNAVNKDMKELRKKYEDADEEGRQKDNRSGKGDMPEAFGPQTQGQFLASMGAVERTIQLIEDDNTTDEQAEDLCTALERLVSTEEMGERFKVMAIARKKDGIFPPPGF